ncbi:twin-arginine translocase TatA/TatE family subunit [Rahnella sp. SAP-1]|uniref:Sec-independent protein translocase protein TatA n=1 Tax=Rouxiella aceris TaxID=2703884 RepID=A0A848MJH0_9GAMM|nr:twin-arginine translocase TatA/TatE family subunit [Rouxiella aceris]NMP27835.1 twin-arginine translocase TatA/TatE family subunit [Rouxiella aceris]
MAGISIWQLLIIVIIVVLLFGTKKLSSLGADLGTSIKGFKNAMSDEDNKYASLENADLPQELRAQKQPEADEGHTKRQHKEQV